MSNINDVSSYDYFLPEELIAKELILPKEEARLLVYFKNTKEIKHYKFKDLSSLIPEDAAVIFNNKKLSKLAF